MALEAIKVCVNNNKAVGKFYFRKKIFFASIAYKLLIATYRTATIVNCLRNKSKRKNQKLTEVYAR